MPIARVGAGSGLISTTAATNIVVPYAPVGTGRLLTLTGVVSMFGTEGTPTVADNIGAWDGVIVNRATVNPQYAFIAYRKNNPAGITSVTVTYNGTNCYGHAYVSEWTGADTTSPAAGSLLTDSGAAPINTLASGNFTPTDPDCLILGVDEAEFSGAANTPWTTTLGPWTEEWQWGDSSTVVGQALYQIATGSGPFNVTWLWTPGDQQMVSVLAAFKPQAAVGTGVLLGQACL